MRPSNSVWQGNFGYWQNSFIHNNLLVIGYTGWKGFQSFGRGVVICDVDTKVTHPTNTTIDTVAFTLQFLPSDLIRFYLRSFQDGGFISHPICSSMISSIFPAIATYNPHQDILLVLKAEPQIEVNFLHQLKITPPDCYEQVCKRWSEFKPSLIP
ncbi:hypothetical protein [Nostoc sp. 'Lobaria pulmonaria (5183) cyanobiont']|uniref:hypothetical protein n=1 Tax=Nostoc sp. 'Lobaria pulmonaria (5183) cyanobiont' TaxID=1618022 RepID=UPI000CF345C4|nr:hypothetical protein [Nostoc sp. 'Lobaria pulmonaria (5183) cyanobiont']AVH69191.1 hypothetical protein NLP_0269 [Nostoc sp. 'Lobaria pulmonaria (5183) cyanobiont']